ncbi:MAG: indole-3-glycerol phosphate synthase TrpC [Lentisphaerae bacterium]|nr:indole-3-glycerol phosphate synthase TrpC [Lentisphaerota bacterium]
MAERRADVAQAKRDVPAELLREFAAPRARRGLAEALAGGRGTRIIAEMKKASPSAGLLRAGYRPEAIARAYAEAGAAAISVLTEPRRFLGSGEHLGAARRVTELPVLRKDFLCDVYQVTEAAAWGADAVLLIAAALDDGAMRELYAAAMDLGLDVLAEAHTAAEAERVLRLERAIVGVNSRDLATLKTDLGVARRLAALIPGDRLSVAESGIRSRADIEDLEARGYNGFLIGETLMTAADPAAKLRELAGTAG